VRDGSTGLLVEENDPGALARTIGALIADPARRRLLGEAGLARVRNDFSLQENLDRLARKFGLPREDRVLRSA
jgi:glycosyltransferase involved in cell wall biosynthesis